MVVRVNGSHLIKNYLITILALIRYAWFSLSRTPQLPRHHSYFFLSRSFYPSRFYSPTLPSPSPFSCLLHHLLTPSSVSIPRSHLLEVSVLVAVFSLFFRRSFLEAASLSSLLSFRWISNHRRANFPAARAYRKILSNIGPLLEPPVDSSTTFQTPRSVADRTSLRRRLFSRLNLARFIRRRIVNVLEYLTETWQLIHRH